MYNLGFAQRKNHFRLPPDNIFKIRHSTKLEILFKPDNRFFKKLLAT